ncbi:MAG: DUF2239 family protein [Armatimonadota bacterium]
MNQEQQTFTAFEGSRRIASGELAQVVLQTKAVIDQGTQDPILIFDDTTSEQIEVDFRGTPAEVVQKLGVTAGESTQDVTPAQPDKEAPSGPGRPKLGVVAREVTLLPRHWEWLNSQPGGASVALRKLVEQARRVNERADHLRRAQEAAYKFMLVMAGNFPGFEEATRALFAGNRERFDDLVAPWPADVRDHAKRLAAAAFQQDGE